ncbi:MAG TPA: SPOR domain-containing protein [Gammaproteobacteria bacterium]|jgi:DedD protein|nr:SPOR domain-containing protein [Gammaproteobacteria bacterium]
MEIGLKERLIGAVVLVVLGIIIIPFFLKGSSPDSGVSQSVTLPPSSATAAPQQYSMALTPAAGSAALVPAAATQAPAVQQAATPAPTPRPVVHSIDRQQAPAPAGKWVVQAGSYGSEANASKVVNTLKQQGYHAYVSRFSKGGQTYYRVRVGPYADRGSADKAATAVARAYGGKADVVPNS